jgi:hypothetical protein
MNHAYLCLSPWFILLNDTVVDFSIETKPQNLQSHYSRVKYKGDRLLDNFNATSTYPESPIQGRYATFLSLISSNTGKKKLRIYHSWKRWCMPADQLLVGKPRDYLTNYRGQALSPSYDLAPSPFPPPPSPVSELSLIFSLPAPVELRASLVLYNILTTLSVCAQILWNSSLWHPPHFGSILFDESLEEDDIFSYPFGIYCFRHNLKMRIELVGEHYKVTKAWCMPYLKLFVPFRPIGEINCMGKMIAEPACDLQIFSCVDRHPQPPLAHRLNIEIDLQSLFGLHGHSCTHWLRHRTPPPPPLFRLIYEGAIGRPR